MIQIKAKSALQVYYYLAMADGAVTEEERALWEEIGKTIDPTHFPIYRDKMIAECEAQLAKVMEDEDRYNVISEGVDIALHPLTDEEGPFIVSRNLVWDMLVLAHRDGVESAEERLLIKHIARILPVPYEIYLEMDQLVRTSAAIEKELGWLQNSSKPYAEIRPQIEELELRQRTLAEAAQALIADEQYVSIEKAPIPKTAKPLLPLKAAPAPKIAESAQALAGKLGSGVANAATGLSDIAGNLFKKK